MTPQGLLEPTVAVYGASSSRIDPAYLREAYTAGKLLAEAGFATVCGGGAAGIMAAAIEGTVDAGGTAVGVLPDFMVANGWAHARLSRMLTTRTMAERKMLMTKLATAGTLVFPGGIGTLDELSEMMTLHQLDIYARPVVIVNVDGFYDTLLKFFAQMADGGFMRDASLHATVVPDARAAVDVILNANA